MEKENKKSKKKILLYYLILAACLLVIAAITVTVIFTVNRPADNLIDSGNENPDDGNQDGKDPDDGKTPGDGNQSDNETPDDNKDNPTGAVYEFILPVESATVTTSYEFGYDVTLDRYCVHQGMDFAGTAGDSVCAVRDGTVKNIVTGHKLGENYITLEHNNGVTTTYKYVEVNENLAVGDAVKQGDVIGTIAAATGYEMQQGDHLHFEISVDGKIADPSLYLDIAEK